MNGWTENEPYVDTSEQRKELLVTKSPTFPCDGEDRQVERGTSKKWKEKSQGESKKGHEKKVKKKNRKIRETFLSTKGLALA